MNEDGHELTETKVDQGYLVCIFLGVEGLGRETVVCVGYSLRKLNTN